MMAVFLVKVLRVLGRIAALWGYAGVLLLFSSAIYRLGQVSLQLTDHSLTLVQWGALVLCLIFMGYAEGYKGFQKGFSPRVAARIYYLSQHVTPVRLALAPLFCMGFFHIEKRRQKITFMLVGGIFVLVQLVHMLEQPWRGIVDAGVVLGLSWGIITLTVFTLQAFSDTGLRASPEVPEGC